MGSKSVGKGKALLAASVPEEIKHFVRYRSERLGWSESRYVRAIVEHWMADGAPPVNEIETAVMESAKAIGSAGVERNLLAIAEEKMDYVVKRRNTEELDKRYAKANRLLEEGAERKASARKPTGGKKQA